MRHMCLDCICCSDSHCLCVCRFLQEDLAAVNRTVTPWVVVNGHRPIYTTSTSGGSITSVIQVADDLRDSLEQLFFKYQVSSLS